MESSLKCLRSSQWQMVNSSRVGIFSRYSAHSSTETTPPDDCNDSTKFSADTAAANIKCAKVDNRNVGPQPEEDMILNDVLKT